MPRVSAFYGVVIYSLSSNNPYHIEVTGGGPTPSAAEANAVSKVPDNCTKPWVIDGPYINDGEWVVIEEATCVYTG